MKKAIDMLLKNKTKIIIKYFYYRTLCLLLNPQSSGANPYEKSPLKLWFTNRIPGNNKSAVLLFIKGRVQGVGFRKWLSRNARINGLECWVRYMGREMVEALLIGTNDNIERVIELGWKGPKKARVLNIEEYWFNRSVKILLPEVNLEENKSWQINPSLKTMELYKYVIKKLKFTNSLMSNANKFDEEDFLNSSIVINHCAIKKNLFVASYRSNNFIVSPKKEIGFKQAVHSKIQSIVDIFTNQKHIVKTVIKKANLPTSKGQIFINLQSAKSYMKQNKKPLVVKPADGRQGKGVTVGVRNLQALEIAWDYAKKYHEQVVIEELVYGIDLRIWVIGGKAYTALLRIPAHVIGDGEKTIKQLIVEKNNKRLKNPHLKKKLIIPDISSYEFIRFQGHTIEDVLKKDELIFLHLKANIAAGGDSVNVTNYMHPDLLKMAEEAALATHLGDYCGIDLLVEKIDLPRNQQKCCIVEVNSRANIFMAMYPMYGEPADTAQALIDHLFPEDTSDEAYPIDTLRVEITGVFDESFYDWAAELGRDYNLSGYMRPAGFCAEAFISGRRHHVLYFLDRVLSWEQDGSMVDGLQVFSYNGQLTENFTVTEAVDRTEEGFGKLESIFDPDQLFVNKYASMVMNSIEEHDLNSKLFIEALEHHGYQAKLLYEDLIEINKDGLFGITGMRHSSLFCDEVCENIYPAKKLLSFKGLPVSRGNRFKCSKVKNALDYFNKISKPCVATELHPHGLTSHKIKSKDKLKKVWKKARGKGTNFILLEEEVKGWQVCVAVVGEEAVASLIVEPLSIQGDGVSSIARLIEAKNELRAQNPWYTDKLLTTDKQILKSIEAAGYHLDDVPAEGKKVYLKTDSGIELDGETIGLGGLLHEDFKKRAVQAISAIPGLEYAVVHMIIPCPERPVTGQHWVVKKIDTSPDAAMFQYPWKGEPYNLAKKVVEDLCLKGRTKWIEEKG